MVSVDVKHHVYLLTLSPLLTRTGRHKRLIGGGGGGGSIAIKTAQVQGYKGMMPGGGGRKNSHCPPHSSVGTGTRRKSPSDGRT